MPWNGSGTFNRDNGINSGTQTWQEDRDDGINIVASNHDIHDQDIADGLENCVTRDGQNSPTANLPMNNFRHTGVSNGAARTDYLAVGQIQDAAVLNLGTTTGAANVYAGNLTPALPAYIDGAVYTFKAHQANTGSATLNINGLGALLISLNNGASLYTGAILINITYFVLKTASGFILLNPNEGQQTWTPTTGATGSMTWTGISIAYARYQVSGCICTCAVRIIGTIGGTLSTGLTITLPIAAVNPMGGDQITNMSIFPTASGVEVGHVIIPVGSATATISRNLSANYGAGAGLGISGTFQYLIA